MRRVARDGTTNRGSKAPVAARGGDAGGAQIERSLAAAWGLGIAGVALAVLPIALVWIAVSVRLGSAQSQLADRSSAGHR